jgi:hypothetical protein
VRVVAINVNHRIRHKPVPDGLLNALLAQSPDVLILTEFVEGMPRPELRSVLDRSGLGHFAITNRSEYAPGRFTNQILAASRQPIEQHALPADAPNIHVSSNTLLFAHPWGNMLAARRPLIRSDRSEDVLRSWDWICRQPGDILIGDINFDPFSKDRRSLQMNKVAASSGWTFAPIRGEWSYCGHSGRTTRIDHAAVRFPAKILSAEYASEGIAPTHTDHAALVIDLAS